MADNTKQFEGIVYIKKGLDWLFADDPQVFVAGDLLWYPVEGNNQLCLAPDTMVAFGRPKGDRGSYQQWNEGGIAPQVVFEVMSPNNTKAEMTRKLEFYQRHGVEECYEYDSDRFTLKGWLRQDDRLVAITSMQDWCSPRLGITLRLDADGNLELLRPDRLPFETYKQIARRADLERQRADLEHQQATLERRQARQERQRADQERQRAQQAETQLALQQTEIERLQAQLRALGIDPSQ